MPSLELFSEQSAEWRNAVLPPGVPRVAIEVGHPAIWRGWVGEGGLVIGLDRFGASAPAPRLAEEFGFTAEKVTEKIREWAGV
jgi:transketolase